MEEKYTSIYLVENCYGDPNKVYVGKEKSHQKGKGRKKNHQKTYGSQTIFTFIDQCLGWDKINWKPLECFYISYFKFLGFDVLNDNEGGGGPSFHTQETCVKMSSVKRPGTSQKLKGRKRPDISHLLLGSSKSEITKLRISEGKKGNMCYNSPQRIEKITTSNKEHYKKGSNRNKIISNKLKGREKNIIKTLYQVNKKGEIIRVFTSRKHFKKELNININKNSKNLNTCKINGDVYYIIYSKDFNKDEFLKIINSPKEKRKSNKNINIENIRKEYIEGKDMNYLSNKYKCCRQYLNNICKDILRTRSEYQKLINRRSNVYDILVEDFIKLYKEGKTLKYITEFFNLKDAGTVKKRLIESGVYINKKFKNDK